MKNLIPKRKDLNKSIFKKYVQPAITVDNLLFTIDDVVNHDIRKLNEKKLQVLLIKRAKQPYQGTWCLPGVFVQYNETLESAYRRALNDKAAITNLYLEQLYTFDEPHRDSRGRIISVTYMGLVNKSETQLVNLEKTSSKNKISEAAEVSWFNLQVTQDKKKRIIMTFDNADGVQFETLLENNSRKPVIGFDHAKIIHYGLTRLRNKIEWTNIAFSMLPKEFTLAELQQVYELILDKKFTKANFQRKVKDNLQALAKYKVGGFRPAEFYSYKAK